METILIFAGGDTPTGSLVEELGRSGGMAVIRRHARQGDMVVCLGAGLSTEWANALPEWLAEEPRRLVEHERAQKR